MRIVTVLGLMFTLVFGLAVFGNVVDLQTDIVSLTSGGIAALAAQLPTFWFLLLALVGVAAVIVAAKVIF